MPPLRILQLNAQGLYKKLPLVADLLTRYSIDVFLAHETLLNPRWRATLAGYTQYRTPKTPGLRGLIIYVRKELKHELLALPATPSLETLTVRVHVSGTPLLIVNIFNSPSNRGLATQELSDVLNTEARAILAGDFNALHPAWNKSRRNTAGTHLYNHSLQQDYTILAPSTPTRVDPRNGASSTLDIALLRDIPYLVSADTLDCVGSDHNPVLVTIHGCPEVTSPPFRLNYGKADWPRFQSEVHHDLRISRFESPQAIDEGVEHLTDVIQQAIISSIPQARTTRKPDTLPPHLLALKRHKNAAKRRWVKYRRTTDRTAFNYAKSLLQTELRVWRDQRWASTLTKLSN